MTKSRINLENLRRDYDGECRNAFEDMVTHMFMRKLKLCRPPIRRKNQEGVESDPVDVVEDIDCNCKAGRYAYQAKYLDPQTEISSIKKCLIKSIKTAQTHNVTDLFLYVNKHLTEVANSKVYNRMNSNMPFYQKEINKAAMEAGIKIHWYPCDVIETDLGKPDYNYIRKMFLLGENEFDAPDFYQHICEKLSKVDENHKDVYGDISLCDSYIEPIICKRNSIGKSIHVKTVVSDYKSDEHEQSVKEYLENWVTGENYVTIICGEPGHGKTSLGQKAVYDFYKNGWLENRVKNVFCFSINPAGLDEEDKKMIFGNNNLFPLLSWESDENNRTESTQRVKKGDCSNALLFLDGFDELLESIPGHDMEEFLRCVWVFLRSYDRQSKPHIVITTRTMAIPPNFMQIEYEFLGNENKVVPIFELQPVSEACQYEWIENYRKHLQKNNMVFSTSFLSQYRKMYRDLKYNDELKKVLGIPIIFRMLVVAEHIPNAGNHPVEIFDELFDKTLERHNVLPGSYDKELYQRKLSMHAIRVYIDNGDSAEVRNDFSMRKSPWIYAFYTNYKMGEKRECTDENILRVGFLHKTFYEYFMAVAILSWMKYCGQDGKLVINGKAIISLADMFYVLGKRKLSEEVLISIKMLYKKWQNCKSKISEKPFEVAYKILRESDGILPSPNYNSVEAENEELQDFKRILDDYNISLRKDTMTPLEHGEIVFWNIVSICSICGYPVIMSEVSNGMAPTKYSLNNKALRTFNLEGIHLEGANLTGLQLRGARFSYGYLIGANLSGSILQEAELERVNLNNARLEGTVLKDACITGGDFSNAHLEGAVLEGADISFANMRYAVLKGAYFDQPIYDEREQIFRGVSRVRPKMLHMRCFGAKLQGAFLSEEQAQHMIDSEARGVPDKFPVISRSSNADKNYHTEEDILFVNKNNRIDSINLSKFGRYKQGEKGEKLPLSWKLLRLELDKALIITDKVVEYRKFSDYDSLGTVTWENSDLRRWLNEEFINQAFTKSERKRIAMVCNQNGCSYINQYSSKYRVEGGNPTWDRVFALSYDEMLMYLKSMEDVATELTPYLQKKVLNFDHSFSRVYWWCRTPYVNSWHYEPIHAGGTGAAPPSTREALFVRPVLWLNL